MVLGRKVKLYLARTDFIFRNPHFRGVNPHFRWFLKIKSFLAR